MRMRPSVAVVVSIIAATLPGPALADPGFEASVAPATFSHPFEEPVEHRLTIRTADGPALFGVTAGAAYVYPDQGRPLRSPEPPALEGPGEILDNMGGLTLDAGCTPSRPNRHGANPELPMFNVRVPAYSHTVLVVRFRATDDAPWPDAHYGGSFLLSRMLHQGRGTGTLARDYVIRTPRPLVTPRRRGVRIDFQTTPFTRSSESDRAAPRLRLGQQILISGRTRPARPGRVVRLEADLPNAARRRVVARARVDRRGRFRARWTPPRRGRYGLWAFIGPSRGFAADFRCPRQFRVASPR